jgi:hypothetical protein
MKKFPGIHALRASQLIVVVIAAQLFIASAHELRPNGQEAFAKVTTFSSLLTLQSQGRTIEIDIRDKEYVPPGRTPKIPSEFKKQGVRYAVRPGDTIKICNQDKFVAKPFSVSPGNKFDGFDGPAGLRPGSCVTHVVKNDGQTPIRFYLADDIHTHRKLFLVVLPTNWPDEGEENTPPAPQTLSEPYAPLEGGEIIGGTTPDLEGTWVCKAKCPAGGEGKTASIEQSANGLFFTNEGGGKSLGHFNSPTSVVAEKWGNLTGTITNGGKEIHWANGTIWVKR